MPQILLMENVPDVIGIKNYPDFMKWYAFLESIGYQSYYKVLNAKDFGIPQNRSRCFMVSILGDYNYEFPREIPLELRLKDMLEDEVDEKYYLSDKQIEFFQNSNFNSMNRVNDVEGLCHTLDTMQGGNREPKIACNVNPSGRGMNGNVYNGEISPTLTTNKGECIKIVEPICLNSKVNGKQPSVQDRIYDTEGISTAITTSFMPSIQIKEATQKGYDEAYEGDYVNLAYPDSTTRRGRVGKQVANILLCNDNNGVVVADGIYTGDSKEFHGDPLEGLSRTLKANKHDAGVVENNCRIRKLTPLECWRLMGFTDDDFNKAAQVNSNSQLYKQAGNSIVKQVLMAIFKELF